VDALGVVAGEDEHLGGGVGTDPEGLAKSRGGRGELAEDLVMRADLVVESDPAPSEGAQRVLGRGEWAGDRAGPQGIAAIAQLRLAERVELVAEIVGARSRPAP
jgi:hypothetical protein